MIIKVLEDLATLSCKSDSSKRSGNMDFLFLDRWFEQGTY